MPERRPDPTAVDIESLSLRETPEGTRLRLRVKPGARLNGVLGIHGGALKVAVTSPAERGKANAAVLRVLSDVFDAPAAGFRILAGDTSANKSVLLPLGPDAVARRLRRILSRRRKPQEA